MPNQTISMIEKYVAECDSTNTYIKEHYILDNKDVNVLLRTDYQINGKGQGENFWESEKDKNLLISFVLYIQNLLATNQFYISKWISVSLLKILSHYVNMEKLWVKWPNDIYYDDKKIAGILIENTIVGISLKKTIIGVGLNINQSNFNSSAPNPISLYQILDKEINVKEIYDKVKNILLCIPTFDDKSFLEKVDKLYYEKLYWKGEKHHFMIKNSIEEGVILGTDEFGFLKLYINNRVQTFDIKEVEYIK